MKSRVSLSRQSLKSHSSSAADVEPNRRHFLAWAAGIASLGLGGCGGGGGAGGDGSDGAPPLTAEEEERLAAAARIEAELHRLQATTDDRQAVIDGIAAFMSKEKVYTDTGITPGTLDAWGVFTDGSVHIVSHSFSPTKTTGTQPASAAQGLLQAAVELPSSGSARLMHSFGANFDGQRHVAKIGGMLSSSGYQIAGGTEGDARLTTLRTVHGHSFFYLQSHGGLMYYVDPNGQKTKAYIFSVQSSTRVEGSVSLPEIRDDLANGRLTWFTASTGDKIEVNGKLVDHKETRFGINDRFVDRYWQFAPNSLVIIYACNSASIGVPEAADSFIAACHRKGAGVYAGWTEVVSAAGGDAIEYYADRLLGANVVQPEKTKQRAFPSEDVLADMDRKKIRRDPDHGALLVARRSPLTKADGILAPSIHHLEVNESAAELALVGHFGSEPGVVSVGGTNVQVLEWTADRVRVRLASPGSAGADGQVIAKVAGHSSNGRWLSTWAPHLKYTWIDTSRPSLRVDGDAALYFRADVGAVRDHAGDAPFYPVRYAAATTTSSMVTKASGSFNSGGCLESWSGTMDFPVTYPISAQSLLTGLRVDGTAGVGRFGLAYGAAVPGLQESDSCAGTMAFVPPWSDFDGAGSFPLDGVEGHPMIDLPALYFDVKSADFVIPARTYTSGDGLTLSWGSTAPSCRPTGEDAV